MPYPSSFTLANVSTCSSNHFWFRSRWACASIFSSSVWISSSETSSRLRSALTLCASVQATWLLGHRRAHLCGPRGEAVARGGDPAQRRSELSVSPKVGDQLGVIRLVAHAGARQVTPRQERRVASGF